MNVSGGGRGLNLKAWGAGLELGCWAGAVLKLKG